jgi:hypothetical protein
MFARDREKERERDEGNQWNRDGKLVRLVRERREREEARCRIDARNARMRWCTGVGDG